MFQKIPDIQTTRKIAEKMGNERRRRMNQKRMSCHSNAYTDLQCSRLCVLLIVLVFGPV